MNDLYSMDLHDELVTNTGSSIMILRVPGGWIYTVYVENGTGGHDMSSCFVPYDNGFDG